jgi:nanoRNase/pAp phosphatase (c-di-AMP/oligoRNAs hydrolase)
MSDDATQLEFDTWADLFELREPTILKKIVHFERPKFWIDHKASAVKNAQIQEGLGVVGLGIVPARHRDMLADMADEMVSWEAVNTAVVFAVVDGDRIEGSVRSRDSKVIVPNLCKSLAGKHGAGGGKLGKGAYRYTLGGVSFDEEDDDETCNKTWELLNDKETKRILRTVRK